MYVVTADVLDLLKRVCTKGVIGNQPAKDYPIGSLLREARLLEKTIKRIETPRCVTAEYWTRGEFNTTPDFEKHAMAEARILREELPLIVLRGILCKETLGP